MSILQRIRDWRHERYIHRLSRRVVTAHAAGDHLRARVYWYLLVGAIGLRSSNQVARMESRMGVSRQ